MTEYNTTINIGVNATGATTGAQQVTAALGSISSATSSAATSLNAIQSQLNGLQNSFSTLNTNIRAQTAAITQSMQNMQASSQQAAAGMQASIQQAAAGIQASMSAMNATMQAQTATLSGGLGLVGNAILSAGNAGQAAHGNVSQFGEALTGIGRNAVGLVDGLNGMVNSLVNLKTVLGVVALEEFGKSVAETYIQEQAFENTMHAVTSSAGAANLNLEYFRATTEHLGINTLEASQAFVTFLGAIQGTVFEGQGARDLFTGVADAITGAHRSTADMNAVLRELDYMLQKNQINLQQAGAIARRIPGALDDITRAARNVGAIGLDDTLAKITKQGVAAEPILLELAKIWQEKWGKAAEVGAQSFQASMGKFQNSWNAFKEAIANAGFIDAVSAGMKKLSDAMNSVDGKVAAHAIGQNMADGIKLAGDAFSWLQQHFDSIMAGTKAVGSAISLVFSGIGTAFTAIQGVVSQFGVHLDGVKTAVIALIGLKVATWFIEFGAAVVGVARPLIGLIGNMMSLTAVVSRLGAMMLLTPWGAAIAGAAALAGGVYYLATRTDEADTAVKNANDAFDKFSKMLGDGTGQTNAMTEAQARLAEQLGETAVAAKKVQLDQVMSDYRATLTNALQAARADEAMAGKEGVYTKVTPEAVDQVMNSGQLPTGIKPEYADKLQMLQTDLGNIGKDIYTMSQKTHQAAQVADQAVKAAGGQGVSSGEVQGPPLPPSVVEPKNPFRPAPKKANRSGEGLERSFERRVNELKQEAEAQDGLAKAYQEGDDAVANYERTYYQLQQTKSLDVRLTDQQKQKLMDLAGAVYDAKSIAQIQKYVNTVHDSVSEQDKLSGAADKGRQALNDANIAHAAYEERLKLNIPSTSKFAQVILDAAKAQQQANAQFAVANQMMTLREQQEEYEAQSKEHDSNASKSEQDKGSTNRAALKFLGEQNISPDSDRGKAYIKQATDTQDAKDDASHKATTQQMQQQLDLQKQELSISNLTGRAYDEQKAIITETARLKQEGLESDDAEYQKQLQIAKAAADVQYQIKLANDSLGSLGKMDTLEAVRGTTATALGDLENGLVDIVTGAKSAKEAFADMAKAIAKDLADLAIRMLIIRPLAMMFGGMMGGGGEMAGAMMGGMAASGATSAMTSFTTVPVAHAKGGVMTSMGEMPLNTYAGGGVASSPQVSLFGEGSGPEAYVPLPDGRSIPVQMAGMPKGGMTSVSSANSNITVHVNQPPGADAKQGQQFGDAIAKAVEAQVIKTMTKQKRVGGLLDPYGMNGSGY